MNLDTFRKHCLSHPGATEQIQWGANLVFKVGGKMFAVAATDPGASHRLSLKCSDERFSELVECQGVVPAPYLARAKWVALETFDALSDREIRECVDAAYRIVFAGLTKKAQAEIGAAKSSRGRKASRPASR